MSRASERAVVRAAPASWVIALVVAFCAVLLLKWLAVVALAAVVVFVFVRWARGGWDRETVVIDEGRSGGSPPLPRAPDTDSDTLDDADVPAPRPSAHDDCTWCGLRGGHRDGSGRLVRPRHAHAV